MGPCLALKFQNPWFKRLLKAENKDILYVRKIQIGQGLNTLKPWSDVRISQVECQEEQFAKEKM